MEQLFEIRSLGTTFDSIDDDISLLWIVQPKDLSNATLYAIDQFVLRGGKAIIFVDPLADSDPAPPMQGMPPGMPPMGQGSDLPALFDAWGIEFSAGDVVADAQLALQISAGASRRPIRHFGFLGVTTEQLDQDDVVNGGIEHHQSRDCRTLHAEREQSGNACTAVYVECIRRDDALVALQFPAGPIDPAGRFHADRYRVRARGTGQRCVAERVPVRQAGNDGR